MKPLCSPSLPAALLGLSLLGALAPAASADMPEKAKVSIYYNNLFIGNGVLIENDWVLTSAMIVEGRQASLFRVGTADVDVCSGPVVNDIHDEFHTIDSYTWPNATSNTCGGGFTPPSLADNIALMHLTVPVVPDGEMGPIALADPSDSFAGSMAEIRGWWKAGLCAPALDCTRQSLNLPVISQAEAQAILSGFGESVSDCDLAVLDPAGLEAPTQGGMGSGAYVQVGGNWVVAGILNYGFSGSFCAKADLPTIFARVSSYRAWIDSVTTAPPPISIGSSGTPCGTGCSPSLTTFGSSNEGNSGFRFDVGGAPAGTFVGLFVGVGAAMPGIPFGSGLIYAPTGVSFWHWDGFPAAAGGPCAAEHKFPFPIPNAGGNLVGVELTAQGVLLCPSLTAFEPTNAVTITIF